MTSLPAEIRPILRRYSRRVDESELVGVASYAGFSGACVWRLTTADSAWALRKWPRGALPAERLRGLHQLLRHLHHQGVTFVAVPIADDAGQTLIDDGGQLWQMEPWLPGQSDFHSDPHADRLTAAMHALAAWHRAAATFSPADAGRRWFAAHAASPSPAVGERLQLWRNAEPILARAVLQNSDPRAPLCRELAGLIRLLGPKIAEELAVREHQPVPLQPCLRDVWHDHVLFTGNTVTGLIDPSACRTECVAADLSRLLGSLIEDDAAAWEAALTAYQQQRPLSLSEQSLIGVLDRSGVVLSALTWVKWIAVENRTFPNPAAVDTRMQVLHRRLVRLAQRW